MRKKLSIQGCFAGFVILSALLLCSGFVVWDLRDPDNIEASKAELYLSKVDEFHPDWMPSDEKFFLRFGENRKNFREYTIYFQSGEYQINLFGPEGT